MAIYTPPSRRRRLLLIAAGAAFLLGAGLGFGLGRSTAPTVAEQLAEVRSQTRTISAGLRVLALHDQAGALSTSKGDGGAALVLQRTRTRLTEQLRQAPWVTRAQETALLNELDQLTAQQDTTSSRFGDAAQALADHIDATFAAR